MIVMKNWDKWLKEKPIMNMRERILYSPEEIGYEEYLNLSLEVYYDGNNNRVKIFIPSILIDDD